MGNEKFSEQSNGESKINPEQLQQLQGKELADALKKVPITELKKIVPNFTVEQLVVVIENISNNDVGEVFSQVASEKIKALQSAYQVHLDEKEAVRLQKELQRLEQNEALEKQIDFMERQVAESQKTIKKLSEQKVMWDLGTDFNESIDAAIQAQQELLVEYERVRTANKALINNPNYTGIIQPDYNIYTRHRNAIGKLIADTERQAANGIKGAKVIHGIAKEIGKGIVAIETGGNPVAVAATGAGFDSILGVGDIATGEKSVDDVLLALGTSFGSDVVAGYFSKIPGVKSLAGALGPKIGKKLAEYLTQKLGASIIKMTIKNGTKAIKGELVWQEVEKDLPADTPDDVRQKMKSEIIKIDTNSILQEFVVELGKNAIPIKGAESDALKSALLLLLKGTVSQSTKII